MALNLYEGMEQVVIRLVICEAALKVVLCYTKWPLLPSFNPDTSAIVVEGLNMADEG
jgi:hypothetical protein